MSIDTYARTQAVRNEQSAWQRYRAYALRRGTGHEDPHAQDETSIALFRDWQILRAVRDSFRLKRRSYRKGGLNL